MEGVSRSSDQGAGAEPGCAAAAAATAASTTLLEAT